MPESASARGRDSRGRTENAARPQEQPEALRAILGDGLALQFALDGDAIGVFAPDRDRA